MTTSFALKVLFEDFCEHLQFFLSLILFFLFFGHNTRPIEW